MSKSLPQEWKDIRGTPFKQIQTDHIDHSMNKDHDEFNKYVDRLDGNLKKSK